MVSAVIMMAPSTAASAGDQDACHPSVEMPLPPAIRALRDSMWAIGPLEFESRALAIHDSIMASPTATARDRALAFTCIVDANECNLRWGQPARAEFAWRAVQALQESFAPCHPEVARTLTSLVRLEMFGKASPARAESVARAAIEIQAHAYGRDHCEYGNALTYLVMVLVHTGRSLEALDLSREAAAICEGGGSDYAFIRYHCKSTFGFSQGNLGDGEACLRFMQEGMAILERHRPDMLYARAAGYRNIGAAYAELGDLARAQAATVRSLSLVLEMDRRHSPIAAFDPVIDVYEYVGVAAALLGDFRQAEGYLEEALRPRPTISPRRYASIRAALAGVAMQEGRLDEAHAQLLLANEAIGRPPEVHPERVVAILEPLVACQIARGRADSALVVVEEINRLVRGPAYVPCTPQIDRVRLLESEAAVTAGNHDRAVAALDSVIHRSCPLTLDRQNSIAKAQVALAAILAGRGEVSGARRLVVESAAAGRRIDREAIRNLPERQALRLSVLRETRLDLLLPDPKSDSTAQAPAAAEFFDTTIRSRGIVLDELAKRRRRDWAGASWADSMAWEARREAQRRLRSFQQSATPDLSQAQRAAIEDRLRRELHEREVPLAHAGIQVAEPASSDEEFDLEQLISKRPRDASIVAYTRIEVVPDGESLHGERHFEYVASVLPLAVSSPSVVRLGSAEPIEALVREWRELADGSRAYATAATPDSVGMILRRKVWDPIETLLGASERVILVPEAALSFVNFDALPAEDGRYLAECHRRIDVLSRERDLAVTRIDAPRAGQGGLLALAGVEYDHAAVPMSEALDVGDVALASPAGEEPNKVSVYRGVESSCRPFADHKFSPLPDTQLEGEELFELWREAGRPGPARFLRGRSAGEQAFKRLATRSDVLHLATHGFEIDPNCAGGESTASKFARWTTAENQLLIDNPLTRCGLALAGANRRAEVGSDEDDGLLTGDEIAALDLSGVEFVVLSACNSGVGEVLDGEGVLGLQRAFKIAGAGPVVMSLWPVEDRVARQWMRHFYAARLSPGVTTSEAVRLASLAMLAERRRLGLSVLPSLWAPFVAVGVDR